MYRCRQIRPSMSIIHNSNRIATAMYIYTYTSAIKTIANNSIILSMQEKGYGKLCVVIGIGIATLLLK